WTAKPPNASGLPGSCSPARPMIPTIPSSFWTPLSEPSRLTNGKSPCTKLLKTRTRSWTSRCTSTPSGEDPQILLFLDTKERRSSWRHLTRWQLQTRRKEKCSDEIYSLEIHHRGHDRVSVGYAGIPSPGRQ